MLRTLLVISSIIYGFPVFAQGYDLEAYFGQVGVEDVSVSPDGKTVCAITKQLNVDKYSFVYSLWRFQLGIDFTVKEQLLLDSGERSYSNLAWSDDNQFLFYISSDKDGRNVFRINMNGGSPSKILDQKSHGGNFATYCVADNQQLLIAVYNKKNLPKSGLYKDVNQAMPIDSTHTTFYKADYISGELDSIFKVDFRCYFFELSPDMKQLLYRKAIYSDYWTSKHPTLLHTYITPLSNPSMAKKVINNAASAWSKWIDNTKLLCVFSGNPENKSYKFSDREVREINLNSGKRVNITKNFSGHIKNFVLLDDNNYLFLAAKSTDVNFYQYQRNKITKITDYKGEITHIAKAKKASTIAFSMLKDDTFTEVYVSRNANGLSKATRLSDFNNVLNEVDHPIVETVTWKNSKGNDIEGVLFWPPGKKGAKNLPFIVDIHGGPWSARYQSISLSAMQYYYYGSFLASKGYLVLQPNYTGSIGRGNAFFENLRSRPMSQPVDDIIQGVDYLKKQGWVDSERMGVMGASYGGFLTNALIGSTNEFKVALSSCGIWNSISDYGTSDGDVLILDIYQSAPWDNFQLYWDESPISNAKKIKTPTLITSGDRDLRVPTNQSISMYRALKTIGTETDLILFPDEGHLYSKPKNMINKVKIELKWLKQYLGR